MMFLQSNFDEQEIFIEKISNKQDQEILPILEHELQNGNYIIVTLKRWYDGNVI